ncbi:MAG: FAD-dependent oxidoreductase [Rhodobacteraceae bacterium]|nr:FAD-dependent oxidoreductase [Paracoccaceae bacterium]
MKNVVVVGGGQAGFSTAAKLRSLGCDARITLVCAENELPYQRPPLSKKYLLGDFARERLYLRPASYYRDNSIDLLLGQRGRRIDPGAKRLELDATSIEYDELVLATGSIPRRLPAVIGGNLEGVHTIRTVADIDSLQPEFQPGRRVLVVGGGYIGLEAASAAVVCGMEVTVIEAADRILQRVACPQTSSFMAEVHRQKGVDLLEACGLEKLLGSSRVEAAKFTDGTALEVDLVVVGIGIVPDSGLAAQAGASAELGIVVDSYGRTSIPHIWAAGDCTVFPFRDRRIRLESVQNAIDQAECVAQNILGAEREYLPVPWFWSDQYDAKLQIAGLGFGSNRILSRLGRTSDSVSFWYMKDDRVLAVDAVNDPRSYMIGKRLIEMDKRVDGALIEDASVNLKVLLRSR